MVCAPYSPTVTIMGVLNVTPDSFSDGGAHYGFDSALREARTLRNSGADIVDIGGDSTRPGSMCVGENEEWRRIGPIVTALGREFPISVDTHHAATAEKALDAGAEIINDISGGLDSDMFRVVSKYNSRLAIMYSRCSAPHLFDKPVPEDLIGCIKDFFEERIIAAEKAGLKKDKLIFDPGMGAFISPHPEDSLLVLRKLVELSMFGQLLIGISRKGFLNLFGESEPIERDPIGAMIAERIVRTFSKLQRKVIIRTHNPKLQRQFLEVSAQL